MRNRSGLISCVSLLLMLCTFAAAQNPAAWATISGKVSDDHGRPVSGAEISVFPMDVAISGPMPPGATSDINGEYKLSLPAFRGRTRLCAAKPSAGYPDTQGLLFASSNESMPIVNLIPGESLENVDILLGPPDGVLTGRVVDKTTRAPISNARITLRREQPESVFSTMLPTDGTFVFALPPAPIEMKIEAPGYTAWKYRDVKSGVTALVLIESEHRELTIELAHP